MNPWREIVDSLPDALIVLAASREPTAHNAAAEVLLGVSHITRAVLERVIEANDWLARMVEACLTSGQNLDISGAPLTLERRTVQVRAQLSPLLGRRGEVRSAIILLSDLSHQRGIE